MANKRLNTTITIGGTVTAGLKSALGSTTSMLKGIGKAVGELKRKQDDLKSGIRTFTSMGRSVDGLRLKYLNNIKAIDALRAAQAKLQQSQERQDRINGRAVKVGAAGVGATVAGGAIIRSVVPGVKESKHYETEKARIVALGMGDKVNAEAFKYAKAMKTFGTSQLENLELLRDGMSVFADLHHAEMVAPLMAKMKFGNKAVFGNEKGEDNSRAFIDMLKVIETRGGLKSQAEFEKQANMLQQVISATGGRVDATEWRNFLMTGGMAGKAMSSESLFYTMEHLVQEMKGHVAGNGLNSLYKSIYQGKGTKRAKMNLDKFGLITDRSKVTEDKAGQVAFFNPGAVMGSEKLRDNPFDWMEDVLLPQLAKKGVTDPKQIEDTMGMIISNSVGGAFLAEMYRQRDNIKRARARNMGAQDIAQLEKQGRETAHGKELDAEAKLADIKLRLGNQILPIYTKALVMASDALEKFNAFSEKNPKLTNALVVGVTALGVGLAVVGPLLVTAAGAMGIYAAGQMMMTRAVVGSRATSALGMLGNGLAKIGRVIPGVLSVIRPLALAFMISSAPMLLVAGVAGGIAAAGLLIWKYWEPLKAFFGNFGTALMAGLAPVGEAISAAFAPVWAVLKPIVMPVLEAIGGWVKKAATWFGELLTPISATSQTTKDFGDAGTKTGEVVAAAFTFMLKPITAVAELIGSTVEKFGMLAGMYGKIKGMGGSSFGAAWEVGKLAVTGDTKAFSDYTNQLPGVAGTGAPPALPPVRGVGAGAAAVTSNTNTFNITQQPGQDARALANEITLQQQRAQAVRARSGLRDGTQ
jgi:hypothetical protein